MSYVLNKNALYHNVFFILQAIKYFTLNIQLYFTFNSHKNFYN